MAISVSARQRLTSGLWGGRLAGSFAGREEVAAPQTQTSIPGGVHKARFLRRGPKLPWDAPEQEETPEVVVTERKKLRRVKLPKEVIETVADAMPVAEAIVLPSYRISIPDIPVKLPDTEEEEAVLMALLL